jgi:hypothetical protein
MILRNGGFMTLDQFRTKLDELRNKYGGNVVISVFAPDEFNNGTPVESPAIISELVDGKGELLSLAIVETHWNPHDRNLAPVAG